MIASWWAFRSGIIPAYAGSTWSILSQAATMADHPRIRGEHSPFSLPETMQTGSSPHTRGAPIFPDPSLGYRMDHPRIRGEHSPRPLRVDRGRGSSPHTRGAHPRSSPRSSRAVDHPRIRGEHLTQAWSRTCRHGSSPHTRGALFSSCACGVRGGIIPAYAGSTVAPSIFKSGKKDHPRIRGEHSAYHSPNENLTGSSPHTRGARSASDGSGAVARIIPAYAGSTRR